MVTNHLFPGQRIDTPNGAILARSEPEFPGTPCDSLRFPKLTAPYCTPLPLSTTDFTRALPGTVIFNPAAVDVLRAVEVMVMMHVVVIHMNLGDFDVDVRVAADLRR